MGKFLLGIIAAAVLAAGLYFYMMMGATTQEAKNDTSGASVKVQVPTQQQPQGNGKKIPPGAVMEDGTIE